LDKIKVSERTVFISEAHYPDYEVKNGSIYFDAIVRVIDYVDNQRQSDPVRD